MASTAAHRTTTRGRDGTTRRGRGGLLELGVIAAMIGGFAAYKLIEALAGPALVWQDSVFYEKVGTAAITSGHFWAGHFPPLVPLVWKLTGTAISFVALQTVISILAWSAASLVLASRITQRWAKVATVALVLALASSQYVVQWDRSILSETITLSMVVLFVTTLVGFVSRPSRGWFAAVVLAAIGMVEARDSNIATVGLAGVGIAVAVVCIYGRRSPRRLMAMAASLFVIALLAGVATAVAGRSGTYTNDDLYVRIFPYPARDAFFAAHGMPDAKAVESLAAFTKTTAGQAPVVVPSGPTFAALTSWIDAGHATGTYVAWLATHPIFALSAPFQSPPETFNNASGDLTFYSALGSISTPVLTPALFSWWASTATAGVAVALAAWRETWRSRAWQGLAALALLGLLTMLIAWQAEGQEVARHTLEGSVQVRLAVLGLLALGVGLNSDPQGTTRLGLGEGRLRGPHRGSLHSHAPHAHGIHARHRVASTAAGQGLGRPRLLGHQHLGGQQQAGD